MNERLKRNRIIVTYVFGSEVSKALFEPEKLTLQEAGKAISKLSVEENLKMLWELLVNLGAPTEEANSLIGRALSSAVSTVQELSQELLQGRKH